MIITKNFAEHSKIAEETLKSLEKQIFDASKYMSECLESGGKILWCGNGGSATDSMHLSSELVGRFKNNRRSLRSISLASDSGNLTCISNDFGYENVFSRQIESLGNKGDILISLSTSGNSKNIIKAIKSANELNITTIAFLGKDGKHFVSTGFDKSVRIWTIGGQTREISGMTARSHSLDTSSNGEHILSGSVQGEIFIWNPDGEVEFKQIHHTRGVHAVAFAKHVSDIFATAGGDGKVTVWNRTSGKIQGNLRGHKGYIRGLAFSPDGKWLASGGQDAKICLWNLETFRLENELNQHTNTVYSLAFSPDSKHLISGSFDRNVIHWTLA